MGKEGQKITKGHLDAYVKNKFTTPQKKKNPTIKDKKAKSIE